METIGGWFWNERIWLPENYTWNDLKSNDKITYTEFSDLIYPILFAFGLILARWITERFFLEKLGLQLGLRHGRGSVVQPPEPKLEANYQRLISANKSKKLGFRDIEKLAKESGLEVRQVERWMRRNSSLHRPSRLNKFSESGWKFIVYGSLWLGGLLVLINKPWFWNIWECWTDFPHHHIDSDIWWYYMMSTAFYWSLFFSQFYDAKRKDFWQMFIHHLTTIGLLCFSWVGNLTRIGSLVILLHDTADVFLELGKMAKYAHKDKFCDFVFGIFTIMWIVTRLGIYPWYILNATLYEATTVIQIFPAYYIFNTMLCLLFVLHIFWTYFILKVAFSAVANKKYEDSRSSTSSSEEDNDDKKDN